MDALTTEQLEMLLQAAEYGYAELMGMLAPSQEKTLQEAITIAKRVLRHNHGEDWKNV